MPKRKEAKKKSGQEADGSGKQVTNAEHAAQIAEVVRLTAADVDRMFPTHAQKRNLVRLLELTNSRLTGEEKADELEDEIPELADVIFKLVRKLVLTD